MATLDAELLAFLTNGPEETGIAAGIDSFNNDAEFYQRATDASTAMHLNRHGSSLRVRKMTAAIAAWIATRPERADPKKSSAHVDNTVGHDIADIIPSQDDISSAILLVMASKVNFWQTNHHTGQGRPSGYFAKCLGFVSIVDPSEADLHAIWVFCHWVNTIAVFKQWNILPGPKRDDILFPKASVDLELRIRSAPAGTAIQSICLAGAIRMSGTLYARVLPVTAFSEARDLVTSMADMWKDRARYHPGSKYLTGHDQVKMRDVGPNLQAAVVAWLKTVDNASSLARSPVINRLNAIEEITAKFIAVRTASAQPGEDIIRRLTDLVKIDIHENGNLIANAQSDTSSQPEEPAPAATDSNIEAGSEE